jgi:hypothetical protein
MNEGRAVVAATPVKYIGHVLDILGQFSISGLADVSSARSL